MRVTEYYIVDAGINSSTISITIQTLQPGISIILSCTEKALQIYLLS